MHTRPAIRRSLMFATVACATATLYSTPTLAVITHAVQTDPACTSRATSWMSSEMHGPDGSVDLWVPADGVGLYSLDTQQWLEPDGYGVFDIYVDQQLGLKLCFHFADDRGAADVWDQDGEPLGTATADLPFDCITLGDEALEQTLDVVSRRLTGPLTADPYPAPRPIPEIPFILSFALAQAAADGSTLTQLRVREAATYGTAEMSLTTDGTHIIWNREDGPSEYIEGRTVWVDVGDAWRLELCMNGTCDDPYVLSEDTVIIKHSSAYVPTPAPPTHSTTIRPIKTCPYTLQQVLWPNGNEA